jgi:hypothetical protein
MFRRRKLKRPISISDLVGKQARRWRFVALHRLEVIRQKWPQAAGDYVARHVVPIRLVRRTLRLVAADSAWATEMTYLSDDILKRLQALLPGKWVDELQCVQGEPLPPGDPPAEPVELKEATDEMRRRVEAVCDPIKDPALGEVVRRAMLKSLRRLDVKAGSALDMEQPEPTDGEKT